nr:MaoC/PaaZ C-terminal domain-containing protein [uncultured Oscillibacter sp.]
MEKRLTIDSRLVGVPWKTATRHIGWRQTTNYAAATHDMNPLYVDDEREEGIIAPPMFAVTLGWPIGRKIRNYIDVPYSREALNRDVHYTEYIEFHQPMKPGEDGLELVIQPMIHAIIPQRAGTNVVYKYEVRDTAGTLYHTEYNGTLLRGVECTDSGKGTLPFVPPPPNPDQVLWERRIHIDQEQTYIYDAATDIVFAIHTSPKYARSVDLPTILVTGTYTIAVGVREMINRELQGDASLVKAINAKLTSMIFPNTDIIVQMVDRVESEAFIELHYRILNQNGAVALNKGYVKALKK